MTGAGVAGEAALHVLAVRGASTAAALDRATGASVGEALAALAGAGLVAPDESSPRRYRLTAAGRTEHARALLAQRSRDGGSSVRDLLARVVAADLGVKQLCTRWQETDASEGAARWDVLADLGEVAAALEPALLDRGRAQPRFRAYADRLSAALDRARRGDARYVASPFVDSFHSVWFELHEDLLLCVGMSR